MRPKPVHPPRLALALLPLAGLVACAAAPEPGEPGYEYNLEGEYAAEFLANDGQPYRGTIRLATAPGGDVSGTLALVDPVALEGTAEGRIVGAQLTLTVSYTIPETGCSGVASGGGTIAEGGGRVAGDVEIDDECGGAPTASSFTFTRG